MTDRADGESARRRWVVYAKANWLRLWRGVDRLRLHRNGALVNLGPGSGVAVNDRADGNGLQRSWVYYAQNNYLRLWTQGIGDRLRLHRNGNLWIAGALTQSSSRRAKQRVRPLDVRSALRALRGLRPKRYAYKADPGEEHLGFIAEDVPELVAIRGRKGLNPMDFSALLTRVAQHQQRRLDRQQRQLERQQRQIVRLLRAVKALSEGR